MNPAKKRARVHDSTNDNSTVDGNGDNDVVVENDVDDGDEYVPLALPPGAVTSAEDEITQ